MDRLDDRFAGDVAPSGAAGHLGQQLERPLAGAEIGEAEADVRRNDANQRDLREVVALGDHLRADKHVDMRRLKSDRGAPQSHRGAG